MRVENRHKTEQWSRAALRQSLSSDWTLIVDDVVLQHCHCSRPRRSVRQRVDYMEQHHVNRIFSTCFFHLRRLRQLTHYTQWSIWPRLWYLADWTIATRCSPDYRGQQSYHCRESRTLQLDSSCICRHVIPSVRRWRSATGCRSTAHPVHKLAFVMFKVLTNVGCIAQR